MRIKVNLQIFIFIIIFILTRQIEIYSWIMLFATLHELGHLFTGLILGLNPKSLHIMPFGLTVIFETKLNKKKINIKKMLIALAGPITNLIIVFITILLKINMELKQTIIYSNILIFIFNLMPVYPLDGGRIIKSLLRIKYNRFFVDKIINRISNIIIIIMTMIGSILVLYYRNISIVFILIYLWLIIIKENKRYNIKRKIYNIIKKENETIDKYTV